MNNISEKEYSFYNLVTAWLEKPTSDNLTKQLISIYLNDEKYKDLDIASTLLYRLTLTHLFYIEDYADFLKNFSTMDNHKKNIYLKIIYAHLVLDKYWDGYVLPETKNDLKNYKIKCNSVYIPVEPPIKSTYKNETPKEKVYIIPGYEKKWREKAIKNRAKATKLTNKYERIKAEKILLKNIKKYGDTNSIEQLALLYKLRALPDLAAKYFEMAKNYGYEESTKNFNQNYKINKCNEYIDLANKNKGTKQELEYLLKVFNISNTWDNVSFRIAKILLSLGTECTDTVLGEKFLIFHLSKIAIIEKYDKHDEFFAYYAKLLYEGTIIKKDKRLAYFCYTCVRNPDDELKTLFEKHIDDELSTTFKTLKNKFLSDTKEEKLQYEIEEQEKKEKEQQEKQLEIEQKSFKNIFNLDPDYKDFQSKSFIENNEEYEKKLKYYQKALESKEEKTIVSNLEKAGECWHRKAMVILFYYYMQKQDIDKMYYWFFKALNFLPYLDEIRRIKADVPINLPAILKYFVKSDDDPKCKEFIEDNFDFESDLDEEIIKEFEKYSKNNFFIKSCLKTYYSTHNESKNIDLLYELATMDVNYDDKVKYIISYIDKMGGLDATLDDKFVKFILDTKLDKNKYVMYHRARLYNDENLCKKYNLTTYPSKVFNILNKANENKTLKVEGLNEKVDMWLGNCYEYGIGTSVDLEKASFLYSPYKRNESGSLYLFNHFAFPELFTFKNFNKIKERFLQDIKIEDYKSTFETIKKFYDLEFSMDEVFDNDGKYIGDKNYYKVIEKEKEIERKRQEEIRKEQERIRLEQERIRQEQERIRQEQERIRLEQERQVKLRKEQEEKERLATEKIIKERELKNKENSQINSQTKVNISQPTTTTNITKTTKVSEKDLIKQVQEKYNKPIEPVRPDENYNDGLTYKQRMRTYGYEYKMMMNNYREKLKFYHEEIRNYDTRLRQAYASKNFDEIWGEFPKIYNTTPDKILSLSEFEYQCQRLIHDKFSISATLSSAKIDLAYIDNYYLERNLASLPCYANELVLTLEYGTYASEIQSYAGRESYSITNAMERFQNSELSKIMTWGEFSSTTNQIGVALSERDKEERSSDYQQGKAYIKNRIWEIVLPVFKSHIIVYEKSVGLGSSIYVVPKTIKIKFKFPGLYDY